MAHPTIEYSVIVAYLVLMLVVGVVFKNFNKNSGDYFRGGSQGTWWIVGMSSFMAGRLFVGNTNTRPEDCPMVGLQDDLRLYPRALSTQELEKIRLGVGP
jgi:hypothetical protein